MAMKINHHICKIIVMRAKLQSPNSHFVKQSLYTSFVKKNTVNDIDRHIMKN